MEGMLNKIKDICSPENIQEQIKNIQAINRLIRLKYFTHNTKESIRVIFICQAPYSWDKMAPVYRYLKGDSRFKTFLVCLPQNIGQLIKSHKGNDTYEWYISHGYPEAINARKGVNRYLDLQTLSPDFVFFVKPYNANAPESYKSNQVSKYAKICYIPYGMNLTVKLMTENGLKHDFLRDVYLFFADTAFSKTYNIKALKWTHILGLQKTFYYGYPSLTNIYLAKHSVSSSWDFSRNDFRIMWTPRWTTNQTIGGSNFFTYYKLFLDYAEKHTDVDWLFRPHPLALANFVKTKQMTQDEVDAFTQKCEDMPNISLDKAGEYAATFWNTDVLISDFSSIVPEYLVTGKPLIYCASNTVMEFSEEAKKIFFEACYVANTPEELFAHLEQLRKGNDFLRSKRQALIKELFGKSIKGHTSKAIAERLVFEAHRRK